MSAYILVFIMFSWRTGMASVTVDFPTHDACTIALAATVKSARELKQGFLAHCLTRES